MLLKNLSFAYFSELERKESSETEAYLFNFDTHDTLLDYLMLMTELTDLIPDVEGPEAYKLIYVYCILHKIFQFLGPRA